MNLCHINRDFFLELVSKLGITNIQEIRIPKTSEEKELFWF